MTSSLRFVVALLLRFVVVIVVPSVAHVYSIGRRNKRKGNATRPTEMWEEEEQRKWGAWMLYG